MGNLQYSAASSLSKPFEFSVLEAGLLVSHLRVQTAAHPDSEYLWLPRALLLLNGDKAASGI